jgi:hypothetical protein
MHKTNIKANKLFELTELTKYFWKINNKNINGYIFKNGKQIYL